MARHKKFSSIGRKLNAEINMGFTYKTERKITSIIVHCSFSPQGRSDDANTIDKWHLKRWGRKSGIGYHYVVDELGNIFKGRWADYPGAHIKGHNLDTIGICRIGGMDKDGNEIEDATFLQKLAIQKLTMLLISDSMYKLLPKDILGHNECPEVNKSCPLLDMDIIREG